MGVIWKPIKDWEDLYEVSNTGLVRNKSNLKIRAQSTTHHGYHRITLWRKQEYKNSFVHRLVGDTFLPKPNGKVEINHKDGVKKNNHVNNLEWVTQSQNALHAFHNKLWKPARGEDCNLSKLTDKKVKEIKKLLQIGQKPGKIAKLYKVSRITINNIKLNRSWTHVSID